MSTLTPPMPDLFEPMQRLTRDLKAASRLLGAREARFLTDFYYSIQDFRIRSANQVRAQEGEPNHLLSWVFDSMRIMENDIKRALDAFTEEYAVGRWMKSVVGVGPVISAGLLSHLDIRRAPTVGHFWRFAGLDPTTRWEKKTKRPWNASLKRILFIAGDCFVKFQNHKDDVYGRIYVARKAMEVERNERGDLAGQAAAKLDTVRIGKDTEAYKHYSEGRLPPAHVHMRALRYASKMFLSHVHHVMHVDYFGREPPVPYSFEHSPGDHRHFVPVPNWPWEGGGRALRELIDGKGETASQAE